ncbi:MAG: hypothetical protein AAB427_10005, partial [Chloroflexota bacterium]
MKSRLPPLALCWLGYFAPWLWPVPAALRLSGYDLVEWMTFAESVRNGTYPVTRLDLLWPLTGIALLTALTVQTENKPPRREERKETTKNPLKSVPSVVKTFVAPFALFAVRNWPGILLSLFASYLILPAYPFILTAPADPELRPQLILGLVTGLAALLTVALVRLHPHRT